MLDVCPVCGWVRIGGAVLCPVFEWEPVAHTLLAGRVAQVALERTGAEND